MMTEYRAANHLSSLPQVLVRVLDAVHAEQIDLPSLAELVRSDPAVASRIMAVANSGRFTRSSPCQTVDRALLILGVDTVKTIVVTAAIRQFFSGFGREHQPFIKAFWRRSVLSAHFAHILANLTGYRTADQAYLGALLSGLGQLILLDQHDQSYLQCWQAAADDGQLLAAEREQVGETHCEVGARTIEHWQIDQFLADAVRYHHEEVSLLLDAHHLVKIINLSSLMSAPDVPNDHVVAQAGALFGLGQELVEELRERVGDDVERLASTLGIDTGDMGQTEDVDRAQRQLGLRLRQLTELQQVSADLWRAPTRQALDQAVHRAAYMMLGVDRSLLFVSEPAARQLQAVLPDAPASHGGFRVPLLPDRSVVSDALLQNRSIDSKERTVLPVLDRQLLQYCRCERLLCLPLRAGRHAVGVLVLGLSGDMPLPPSLLSALAHEIAGGLVALGWAADEVDLASADDPLQHRIWEAIHEAGNPLSIIGNYLEMLRLKLGDQHQANKDIELIKREIDRVGDILLRLREQPPDDGGGSLELNQLIEQLARIFEGSIFASRGLRLELRLDPQMPAVAVPAAPVKQIVINLVKNAAEALPAGGTVTIETAASINIDGRRFAAITVDDDGPGILPDVMDQLFSPMPSRKGAGHGGLGLSITKRLVDELGGTIMCKSGMRGTQFQVLIPR